MPGSQIRKNLTNYIGNELLIVKEPSMGNFAIPLFRSDSVDWPGCFWWLGDVNTKAT